MNNTISLLSCNSINKYKNINKIHEDLFQYTRSQLWKYLKHILDSLGYIQKLEKYRSHKQISAQLDHFKFKSLYKLNKEQSWSMLSSIYESREKYNIKFIPEYNKLNKQRIIETIEEILTDILKSYGEKVIPPTHTFKLSVLKRILIKTEREIAINKLKELYPELEIKETDNLKYLQSLIPSGP